MKKKYEGPKMQISLFDHEELITMSGQSGYQKTSDALEQQKVTTKYKYVLK